MFSQGSVCGGAITWVGECAEPGLGPRSWSAADSLWGVKELSFGVFLKLYKSSRKMHSPYKIITQFFSVRSTSCPSLEMDLLGTGSGLYL